MSNRVSPGAAAAVLAMAAALTLSACVVTPVGPRAYVGAEIGVAPPPPQAEVIGVAPGPGYIWTGGYWGWYGGRYTWFGGHWIARRPGYFWARPHWERGAGGWRFAAGHWARR